MSKSKKMTKKEFFEVLGNAGECDKCFEDVLNSLACLCWEKAHKYGEEGNYALANVYTEEAHTIHTALKECGYFDN